MYAVSVLFTLHPDRVDDFMPLIMDNARRSVAEEPACRLFDVAHNADQPHLVYLYELYDDRAGFDAHLDDPRHTIFNALIDDMVVDKRIELYDTVQR